MYAKYLLGAEPKVTLLYATPEWVVAKATKGYTGVYSAELLTEEEKEKFWKDLGSTKLKEPLAMAQAFFLVEDVTRAFTHQLARYRLGINIVQESQRFSLQDSEKARIMIPSTIVNSDEYETFVETAEATMGAYCNFVTAGMSIQDARAILPTHICTRLFLNVSILTLAHIYEQRSCCQAQAGEWQSFISQAKAQLTEKGFPHYAMSLKAPWEDHRCVSCGFGASFDRPCQNQQKFDENLMNLISK